MVLFTTLTLESAITTCTMAEWLLRDGIAYTGRVLVYGDGQRSATQGSRLTTRVSKLIQFRGFPLALFSRVFGAKVVVKLLWLG